MTDQAYIGRQPILDRQQKIIGYELLFRHSAEASSAQVISDLHAGTSVLANTLSNIGTNWLVADKLAFINLSNPMLETDFIELLPPEKIVLELLETTQPTPELLARCRELRARGFGIALDDFEYSPAVAPLLDVAQYVKVDIRLTALAQLPPAIQKMEAYPVKLLAEKVETRAEFDECKKLGFHYFQGYYFARPETLSAKVINPAHAHVLELLNKVRNNADLAEIDRLFKRDVALSFKLLRYINSVGFGLSCEIQSIKHALTILGYQQLYRWLTLLLVTAKEDSTPPALMKTAIIRGRLTELLGQNYLEKQDRDNLFIVGVFSLLDVMLEMPMDKVLEQLNLPENICDALLLRQGIYGPFLALAEACEGTDVAQLQQLAESLQLEPDTVNKAHLDALKWVEELGI
ncbi:MAG: EAL and HDOD domain-containing protein [Sulfuricellaceae bacterium]|jgi:EAL and modified HD-GYP domain-containing signal transduction protein